MTLPPLPAGQGWWVAQSRARTRTTTPESAYRVWELTWGATEIEAIANLDDSDRALTKALAAAAVRRGEISDEGEFVPLSYGHHREHLIRVTTLEEVERIDPGLHAMLVEHDCFAEDVRANGPSVIGGGVEILADGGAP